MFPWFFHNIFAVELLISLVFFIIYQPRRKKFLLRILAGLAGYFSACNAAGWLISIAGGDIFSFGGVYYFVAAFSLTLCVWFAYELDFFGALYLITATYAVQHIGYSLAKIIRALTGVLMSAWLDVLLTDFFIYVVVGSVVFFTFVHPHRQTLRENLQNRRALAFSLVSLVLCVLLNAWAESIFVFHKEPFARALRICCCLYAIIGCIFTLFLQFGFIRESRLVAEKNILDQLLYSEKKRHELTKATIEIINAKSHDLKNQIAILANIDDKEARKQYIEEIKKHVSVYDGTAMTGNVALDIILSEKSLLCEKNDIALSYLIDGRRLGFMEAADIAALFGNALDNAIEHLLTEEEARRFISISVKEEHGVVFIHIDNYCTQPLKFVDGLPQTTKEDKRFHGYGTKSIRRVVLKYGGKLCMEVKDDRFNLDIFFTRNDG